MERGEGAQRVDPHGGVCVRKERPKLVRHAPPRDVRAVEELARDTPSGAGAHPRIGILEAAYQQRGALPHPQPSERVERAPAHRRIDIVHIPGDGADGRPLAQAPGLEQRRLARRWGHDARRVAVTENFTQVGRRERAPDPGERGGTLDLRNALCCLRNGTHQGKQRPDSARVLEQAEGERGRRLHAGARIRERGNEELDRSRVADPPRDERRLAPHPLVRVPQPRAHERRVEVARVGCCEQVGQLADLRLVQLLSRQGRARDGGPPEQRGATGAPDPESA